MTAISRNNELVLRVLSALFLIPFGLFVVWKGGAALAFGCALFAALMSYEWVRMSASPLLRFMIPLSIVAPVIAGMFGLLPGFSALIVCAAIAAALHPLAGSRFMSGFGLLYVSGMPLALYALRDGPWQGQLAALLIMAIVWISDSAAYFAGRGFGGPPLSPESPSKTWTGTVGAIVCCVLAGMVAARISGGSPVYWAVIGGLISVVSQSGDLFESALKRRFGVKDASGLVPGHGGILDRVDGFGMVCIIMVAVFYTSTFLVNTLGLDG